MIQLVRDRVYTTQCEFFYVEAGRGLAVLLLHGGNSSHHEWHDVIPRLAERHRVLAPDRPGCGLSTPPREGYGRTTQGRALALFMKAMGEERVAVVGHGLGGFLAIELAAAMPYTVDKLVLISPVVGGLQGRERRLGTDEALAERQLYAADRVKAVESYIEDPAARRGYVESLSEHAAKSDPKVLEDMLAEAGRVPDWLLMRSFRSPTLVVRPARDQSFSRERAERVAAEIPLGRMVELEDAGHFAHVERPEAVAQLILSFLAER